jgi:ring-1,2-phenylacetyl-CoA epoxidase subunit PaaC
MDASTAVSTAPTDYLLHLADNALILGQRNAEWCGHGPIIEEDLSMANNSLDLIGQARLLYQYAAQQQGQGATEDSLAYFRDVPDFRNYTLVELPHTPPLAAPARADRDYATTIVRNFLYSALMVLVWERLQASPDAQLAAIAARSLKEVHYHLRHSRDWLVRFGDGTDESHARAQAALDHLFPYTAEFWTASPAETAAQNFWHRRECG